MKLMALGLVVGCVCFPSMGNAQAVPWTSAKLPGEQNRAVQGRANDRQKAGDWLCIFVRCDQPGSSVSLYFSAKGPDIQATSNWSLMKTHSPFPCRDPSSQRFPSLRVLEGCAMVFLDAMKAGRTLSI